MATYSNSGGSLTVKLLLVNADSWVSLFPSKKNIARVPIPFSFAAGSSQLTQIMGVDNPREKFTVLAENDSIAPALEHLWQAQGLGTLDLTTEFGPGFVFPGVALVDIPTKKRRPYSTDWLIEVEFEQMA